MLTTDEPRPRNEIAEFLRENSRAMQWVLTWLLLNGVADSFFKHQGYWRLPCHPDLLPAVSALLYLFAWFRLVKPNGLQDLKALALLTLIPTAHISFAACYLQAFLYITLLCRWNRFARLVPVFLLPSLVPITFMICANAYFDTYADRPSSPDGGVLIGTADRIYYLYRYNSLYDKRPQYALFRQVGIFPHVELVKQIDYFESGGQVSISRKPDGDYVIAAIAPKSQAHAIVQQKQSHLDKANQSN